MFCDLTCVFLNHACLYGFFLLSILELKERQPSQDEENAKLRGSEGIQKSKFSPISSQDDDEKTLSTHEIKIYGPMKTTKTFPPIQYAERWLSMEISNDPVLANSVWEILFRVSRTSVSETVKKLSSL